MSGVKEIAQKLASLAAERKVRFPKIWDDSKIVQACGTTLLLYKVEGGYDEKAALDDIIEKYGVEEEAVAPTVESPAGSPSKKKRKAESSVKKESGGEDSPKKVRKTDIVAVEENRAAAEAIKEMADIYFKNKDNRKGGVFSKAAKSIRECDHAIKDKKTAMKLPGVGKGIAGYIEELLEKGSIDHLEELRAGTA